jgi:hypothetical protein
VTLLSVVVLGSIANPQIVEHGTTYAVERTPSEVALSIDSSFELTGSLPTQRCKIYASGGVVFVEAGIYGFPFSKDKHSLKFSTDIGDILASHPPIPQIIPKIASELSPILLSFLKTPRGRASWHDGASILQIALAGADNGTPFVRAVMFRVLRLGENVKLETIEVSCPGDCKSGYKSLTSHSPGFAMTRNGVRDVEKWVNADLSGGNPNYLKPIQTVTVSQNGGIHWVNKPDFCPMIPSY